MDMIKVNIKNLFMLRGFQISVMQGSNCEKNNQKFEHSNSTTLKFSELCCFFHFNMKFVSH
jgi:hypothetical protein